MTYTKATSWGFWESMYGRHIYFILVGSNLPILGVDNVVSVPAIVVDAEPHLFKFLDDKDVRNTFLVEPKLNRTKIYLLAGGSGPYIAITQNPDDLLSQVCKKIFIVHMILRVAVVKVDPDGLQFFC